MIFSSNRVRIMVATKPNHHVDYMGKSRVDLLCFAHAKRL